MPRISGKHQKLEEERRDPSIDPQREYDSAHNLCLNGFSYIKIPQTGWFIVIFVKLTFVK